MNSHRIGKLIVLCACVFLPTNSTQAADLGIDGLSMNGLRITGHTWYPTHNGNTIVVPVEIINESGADKEDVRIYVTGVMASPWGLLTYRSHGRWEKTSQYTGETLQAKVGGPKATLPSGQERNVGPGSSVDASYPYVRVGQLNSQETKSKEISVNFQGRGGRGTHYPPYTFWLCLANGGQRVPQKNRPPTAYDAEVTTLVDTPVQITLRATDPDGDDLTYHTIGEPREGSLAGTPPSLTYTPNPGFVGTDGFRFCATDRKTESNNATVTITVTPAGTVPVQYYLGVDDYGDLYIDGQLEAHYDDYPQGGDMTDVLDLSPGWHDIEIVLKNRWGSSSVGLYEVPEPGALTYVPREHLRSVDEQGQFVSGLRADYYTLGGQYIKTVYGEGPLKHSSGRVYEGDYDPDWASLDVPWGPSWWNTFEEKLSGQILVGE